MKKVPTPPETLTKWHIHFGIIHPCFVCESLYLTKIKESRDVSGKAEKVSPLYVKKVTEGRLVMWKKWLVLVPASIE